MKNIEFVSLTSDLKTNNAFSKHRNTKFHNGVDSSVKRSSSDLILITTIDKLENLEEFKGKELAKRVKGLLIKDENSSNSYEDILDVLNLSKFKKNTLEFKNNDELKRIAWAIEIGAQADLIADFRIINNRLILIKSCGFERILLKVSEINALKDLSAKELMNFSIDEHGSYVHWPDADIHLDLESFRIAKNPKLLLKIHKNDKKFGKAIRELREKCNLNQNELGLSDKQVRRFESGESRPTLAALKKMAEKHSMPIDRYLNELAELSN